MEAMLPPAPHAPARHWLLAPYALVLWAVLIGVLLGHFAPEVAVQLKPLGDAFIKAVRLLIAPIVFCTLVHGIASLHAPGKLGRIGTKAIVYFEVVSTFALLLGMLVANQLKPGAGMHSKAGDWEGAAAKVAAYSSQAQQQSSSGMLLDIIPESLPGAFGSGNLLHDGRACCRCSSSHCLLRWRCGAWVQAQRPSSLALNAPAKSSSRCWA